MEEQPGHIAGKQATATESRSLLCGLRLLCRGLLFLRLLRSATLGAAGDTTALACTFRWRLLLLLRCFRLCLGLLASRLLGAICLGLLLLLSLLISLSLVLIHLSLFLPVGFGLRRTLRWFVLRSGLVFIASAALFVFLRDLPCLYGTQVSDLESIWRKPARFPERAHSAI